MIINFMFILFFNYCRESEGVVDLYSTVVPPSHGGQGIGKLLAKEAFEFFAKDGVKMRLTCSFLAHYLDKNPNPDYKKLVIG